MSDDPEKPFDPAMVKYLRRLVTLLTATMIIGFIVLVAVIVIRFRTSGPDLPEIINLPEGAGATAYTQGKDWFAIVTEDDRILIYDRNSGDLRQTVVIE